MAMDERSLGIAVNASVNQASYLVGQMIAAGVTDPNEANVMALVDTFTDHQMNLRVERYNMVAPQAAPPPAQARPQVQTRQRPAPQRAQQQYSRPQAGGGGGRNVPSEKQIDFFRALVTELGFANCPADIAEQYLDDNGNLNRAATQTLTGAEISGLISELKPILDAVRAGQRDTDF